MGRRKNEQKKQRKSETDTAENIVAENTIVETSENKEQFDIVDFSEISSDEMGSAKFNALTKTDPIQFNNDHIEMSTVSINSSINNSINNPTESLFLNESESRVETHIEPNVDFSPNKTTNAPELNNPSEHTNVLDKTIEEFEKHVTFGNVTTIESNEDVTFGEETVKQSLSPSSQNLITDDHIELPDLVNSRQIISSNTKPLEFYSDSYSIKWKNVFLAGVVCSMSIGFAVYIFKKLGHK